MIAGLVLALLAVAALVSLNFQRARAETSFELTPNRLLTRYPLVFLTGRRSLFYFLSYWNELPAFLTAHGYQVYVMPLPWKPTSAKNFLQHYFRRRAEKDAKFHFIIDPSLYGVMEEILFAEAHPQIASVTCAGHLQADESAAPSPAKQNSSRMLKALPVPIEDLDVTRFEDNKAPWWWASHLFWTRQPSTFSLASIGWPFVRSSYEVFLDRAALLAERDLLHDR
jgi:hypothetical protein